MGKEKEAIKFKGIYYVYKTVRSHNDYIISSNPYLFSELIYQGDMDQCEKFIEEQNEIDNSGQQQMGTI